MATENFDNRYDSEPAKRTGFEMQMQRLFAEHFNMTAVEPYGNQGDGGVESYRILKGKYEGMQAKFFDRHKLTANDKTKIKDSFARAIKEWTPLTKYYVNLPKNLERDSSKWVLLELPKLVEGGKNVEVILWTQANHDNLLAKYPHIKADYKHDFQTIGEDVGATRKDVGELKEMITAQTKSTGLSKEDVENFVKKANLKILSGYPSDVLNTLARIEELSPIKEINATGKTALNNLKIRALYSAEKVEEARRLALNLIADDSDNIEAYFLLADIAMDDRDQESYANYISKAESINSEHPKLLNLKLAGNINFGTLDKVNLKESWGKPNTSERAAMHYLRSVIYANSNKASKRNSELDLAINNIDESGKFRYELIAIKYKIVDLLNKSKSKGIDSKLINSVNEEIKKVDELAKIVSIQDTPTHKVVLEGLRLDLNLLLYQNNVIDHKVIRNNIKKLLELIKLSYFDYNISSEVLSILQYPPYILDDEILEDILPLVINKSNSKTYRDKLLISLGLIFIFLQKEFSDELKAALISENLNYINEIPSLLVEGNIGEIIKLLTTIKDDKQLLTAILVHIPSHVVQDAILEEFELESTLIKRFKAGSSFDRNDYDQVIAQLDDIDLKRDNYVTTKIYAESAYKLNQYGKAKKGFQRLIELGSNETETHQNRYKLADSLYHLKEYSEFKKLALEIIKTTANQEERAWILVLLLHTLLNEGKSDEALKIANKNGSLAINFASRIQIAEVYAANAQYKNALEKIKDAVMNTQEMGKTQYLSMHMLLIEIENSEKGIIETKDKVIKDGKFVKIEGNNLGWFQIGTKQIAGITSIKKSDARYKLLNGKSQGDEIDWVADQFTNRGPRKILLVCDLFEYLAIRATEEMQLEAESGSPYIQVLQAGNASDLSDQIRSFLSWEDELLKTFENQDLPLFILASRLKSMGKALYLLSQSKRILHTIDGTPEAIESKLAIISNNIDKGTYLDASTLVLLAESNLLEKFLKNIGKVFISTNALEEYRALAEKFSRVTEKGLTQMGTQNGKITIDKFDRNTSKDLAKRMRNIIELVEKNSTVFSVPEEDKHSSWIEKDIYPAVSEAAIRAMETSSLLVTEDSKYTEFNQILTQKELPPIASFIPLIKYLLIRGLISYEEYLNGVAIAAKYRLFFIPFSASDLLNSFMKVNGDLVTIDVKGLDRLNLKLLLSEEYGTNSSSIVMILFQTLVAIIQENGLTDEILSKTVRSLFNPIRERTDNKVIVKSVRATLNKFFSDKLVLYPTFEQRLTLINELLDLLEKGTILL